MAVIYNWDFLANETLPTNGKEFNIVNENTNITIGIAFVSSATAYEVVFEAKGLIGDYVPIKAWDETNAKLISNITQTDGKLFTLDLTAKYSFRVRVISISGGNISATGKVVQ